MVALKLEQKLINHFPASLSRNAVVALKPDGASLRPRGALQKQERRGGIETGLLLQPGADPIGSRNAVVALKL